MQLSPIANLRDLLDDPGKVRDLPLEAVAALRGELATMDSLLFARLCSHGYADGPAPAGDRRLNVYEAAAKLACTTDWLYRHAKTLPFTIRIGRSLGFSEQGIEKWLRQHAGR